MDNRATPRKGSSINWVYKQGLFSVEENKLFFEMITKISTGSEVFKHNTDGEYMLPIANKIVFTDGNFDSPYVSRVVEVMTDYLTEFEDVRRAIFNVEKGLQSSKYNESQILREMYGDKFIFEYQAYVDGAYEWTTGRRERKNRRSLVEDYRKSHDGKRNSGDGSKNLRDERNDKSGKISSEYGEIKTSLDWVEFEEVVPRKSVFQSVTEIGKINAQMNAHILRIGSSLTKRVMSDVNIQNIARQLKKDYMSKINFNVLADELGTFYGYLANENGLNWENVQIHLEDIATKILDESKFKNPDISDYAKDILRDVRSVKIKLSDRC